MTTELRFKLGIDGAAEVVSDMQRVDQAAGKSIDLWQLNMKGVQAAMRATAEASNEVSAGAQKIMDRYDPLGTKLRALTSDMALMRREMGNSTTDGAMRSFQGLESEIEKTRALMVAAGVASAEGFNKAAGAADKSAFATAGAKRELLVLGHEAMTGNFSRMPGSFMVLAERMSMTEALMSPVTLGLVGVAAAGVGVAVAMAQGAAEQKAMNNALIMTGNYAGETGDSLNALAHSAVASGGSIGDAKKVATELAASGKYTGEQIGVITTAVIGMEHATGVSVEKTIKEFESLAVQSTGHSDRMSNTISQATLKLDEKYHFLTLTIYDQIRALEKEGDMKGASALATNELAKVTDARTKEILDNVGSIAKGWEHVKESIGHAIDRMNDWGKKTTAASEVERLSGVVLDIQNANRLLGNASSPESQGAKTLAAATAELTAAKKELFRTNERAADQQAVALTNQRETSAANAVDQMMKAAQAHSQDAVTAALKKYHAELALLPPSDPRNDPAAIAVGEAALTKQYGEKTHAIRELSDAWQSESAKLYASTMETLAKAHEAATVKADGLGKAQAALLTIQSSSHWEQYGRQQREQIIYAASLTQGEEDRAAAVKASELALKDQEKAIAGLHTAGDKMNTSLDDQILKQSQANIEMGHSKVEIDNLRAVRLNDAAAADEQLARNMRIAAAFAGPLHDAYIQYATDLDNAAKKKRQLAQLQTDAGEKQAIIDAGKEAEKVAERTEHAWQSSNRNIKDGLYNAISQGGDQAIKKLLQDAKAWFARLTLSPVFDPVAAMGASIINPGAASAAGGAAGTGFFAGLGATASGWGTGLANGLSAWGAEGSVAGMLSNASLYSTAEIVGALAPIGVGIMALVAISKATSGEQRGGGQYGYSFNGTDVLNNRRGSVVGASGVGATFLEGPSGGDFAAQAVKEGINATVAGINATLKAVGSAASLTGFQAGYETSSDQRGGVMAGGRLSTGATFGQSGAGNNYDGTLYDPSKSFNMDAKEATAAFALELQQTTIKALQAATDIPKTIANMIAGDANALTADTAKVLLANIDAVVATVSSFNAVAKTLPFEQLKNLGFDAAAGLIAAAGGMDKLGASLGSYYDNFFNAEEKRANLVNNIQAALGASGANIPATLRDLSVAALDTQAEVDSVRIAFRNLVDGAMKDMTPAGQATTAALLAVSGSLGSLLPAAVTAERAVETVVAAVDKVLESLASDRQSLEGQLATAQGRPWEAQGVDLTNAAQAAAWNYNETLRAQIKSIEDAATATRAQADADKQLVIDAQAVSAALKATMQASLDSLDSTKFALQNQLLVLQGNQAQADANTSAATLVKLTTGLSADDAAIVVAAYTANQALQAQITAQNAANTAAQQSAQEQASYAQSMQQAASTAATVAAQLKSAWQGVTDSIMGEVARIRGQMDGAGAQSYAQAQADFAITLAQANSGSQDAARLLPGVSKTMLDLAAGNATSSVELARIQGQTAAKLEALGSQYTDRYGLKPLTQESDPVVLELRGIHTSLLDNLGGAGRNNEGQGYKSGSNEELVVEVRKLQDLVTQLIGPAKDTAGYSLATAGYSRTTAKTLVEVTHGGEAMQTEMATTSDGDVTVIGV